MPLCFASRKRSWAVSILHDLGAPVVPVWRSKHETPSPAWSCFELASVNLCQEGQVETCLCCSPIPHMWLLAGLKTPFCSEMTQETEVFYMTVFYESVPKVFKNLLSRPHYITWLAYKENSRWRLSSCSLLPCTQVGRWASGKMPGQTLPTQVNELMGSSLPLLLSALAFPWPLAQISTTTLRCNCPACWIPGLTETGDKADKPMCQHPGILLQGTLSFYKDLRSWGWDCHSRYYFGLSGV